MKQLLGKRSETKEADFIFNKFIEKGAYGEVHKVTSKTTKRVFAIKKIDKLKLMHQNMGPQIANEVNILYSIKHPNIVKIIDSFESETHLFIVLEYMENGSLFVQLKLKKKLEEAVVRKCLRDVINAVEYLHNMKPPIIHRDIKPENILIDNQGSCKLADFGWSNFSGILRVTYCGTAPYLAPEMILKQGHDERLDYWCLGVLAYELLCGYAPFENGRGDTQQRTKQLQQNILDIKYKFPPGLSKQSRNFIQNLLKRDPAHRMNIEQMKSHQFITGTSSTFPKQISQIIEEDGESEDTEIMRDDPFNILAEKFNKSQIENRLLKEELYFMKEEVKRMKSEKIVEEKMQRNHQSEDMIQELKGKLRAQQLKNTGLEQRIVELAKRAEIQGEYEQELESEIESLKALNREYRKLKEIETNIGDTSRGSIGSQNSPRFSHKRSRSPDSSQSKPIDKDLKQTITQQFKKVLQQHINLRHQIQQSQKRQKELIKMLSKSRQNQYQQRISKMKEEYQQKSQDQFESYLKQLQKLGVGDGFAMVGTGKGGK